jgi:proteic killer suppression protein
MIKSFLHKGLKAFFESGSKAGIQPHHEGKLRRQLARLDLAKTPEDMNLAGGVRAQSVARLRRRNRLCRD